MLRIILLCVLCVPVSAHAWSEADTKRQVAYTALHVIDWGQTIDISERCKTTYTTVHSMLAGDKEVVVDTHPPETSELNPFLGECPSRGEVNRYFLLSGVAHYAISRALPANYRKWWQYATITLEVGVVAHNASIGVHVRF